MELSILVPTFNEADIIEGCLQDIADALGSPLCGQTEILIVDDGKDTLPDVVKAISSKLCFQRVKVLRNNPPLGKGLSLANGFNQAEGKIVGFLDADLSTPPRYILEAFSMIKTGDCDAFIGSRKKQGSHVVRDQTFLKDLLGNGLRLGVRHLLFETGPFYEDTQCGFKFFKNQDAKALYRNLIANDGLTDIEILIKANRLGLRVHEHGVLWKDIRESKRSLARILKGEVVSISKLFYHYRLKKTKV